MPWEEVSITSLRLDFIKLATEEGANMSGLCRCFGINLLPFDPQTQMVTFMSSSVKSGLLRLAFTCMMLNDTIDNMTSFKFILSIVLPMSQNMCYLCPRSIQIGGRLGWG